MATNLVTLIMQSLTSEVVSRIGSALGLNRVISEKVIAGVVPTLLALLGNVVSKPGGERQLANAMAQQPSGALDTLINIISGSGQKSASAQKSFVENGTSLLSGLLGGSTQNALTRAIGQYAGIGDGASKSIVGMLGPIVLDALGREQRSAGLDTHGLAKLLSSQSQQTAAALPAGLAEQMSAAGLMDALGDSVRGAAATASTAAEKIGGASRAAFTTSQAASVARGAQAQWPYWVLGLAVLAGLAWLLAHNWGGDRKVAEQAPPIAAQPRETVGVAPPSVTVGGVNLAYQVSSSINSLQTMLAGVTDAASAQAALPKLRELTMQFDKVNAQSAQLPAEGRKSLANLIATAMPNINSAIERILSVPGVGDVARPVINELRTKIDSLARA